MKYSRKAKILEIIEAEPIETQEELCEKLRELDFEVTQATVSRDMKELKLVKAIGENGKYRYAAATNDFNQISEKMLAVFAHAFVSADYADHLAVIKTLPGMAQAVATTVDSLKNPGILGSIGGDDTVLIICRTEQYAKEVAETFKNIAER